MYKQKTWLSLFIISILFSNSNAQSLNFNFSNKSWEEASQISVGKGFKIKPEKGQGVYFTRSHNAILKTDLSLKQHAINLEFMQSSKGQASIFLQENLKIVLNAGSNSFGALEMPNGKNALPNNYAERAAGLWQTLEIIYNEKGIEDMPTIELIKLNGIKIHENILALNLKNANVSFLNIIGEFAIQNVNQKVYNNAQPVKINNLTYLKLKKTETDEAFLMADSPKKSLTTDYISVKLPGETKDSIIVFKGNIEIEKDDNYTFILEYFGRSSLHINDKLVAGSAEEFSRTPQAGQVFLKKGIHKVVIRYQSSWRSALGLKVSGTNFRPYILNDPYSLPLAPAVGGVFIRKITGRPRVIRSFMMFDDKKRTSVISVGTPEEIHYAIDLEKANLLYAWKGEFADLTEMWHERGEPQILMPLGLKIKLSGKNPMQEEIKFESFILDPEGNPSFNFSCSKGNFTQRYSPNLGALNVSIVFEGFMTDFIVTEGQNIQQISKNTFKVDDHYLQIHSSAEAKIISSDNIKKIVIFNQKDLNYSLTW